MLIRQGSRSSNVKSTVSRSLGIGTSPPPNETQGSGILTFTETNFGILGGFLESLSKKIK